MIGLGWLVCVCVCEDVMCESDEIKLFVCFILPFILFLICLYAWPVCAFVRVYVFFFHFIAYVMNLS